MARYVLLRIEDDEQADDLLRDIAMWPQSDLLTPCQENPVHVEVVPDLDPSDRIVPKQLSELENAEASARGLRAVLRRSYLHAGRLAAEAEAEL